jgi:hypothetical protein
MALDSLPGPDWDCGDFATGTTDPWLPSFSLSKINGLMAFNGGLMGYYGGFFWELMGILMDTWLVVST